MQAETKTGKHSSMKKVLSFASEMTLRQAEARLSSESVNAVKTFATNDAGFPEGGFRAWATVVGAALIQFCGFGYTNSYGVYQDYYTRVYLKNHSSSAISWIGSTNAFLVIASGLYVGTLYDRGYFYHLLYGGSLLISFSLFMLSLAKPGQLYQIFLAQGVGLGLGAGMMYVPSVAVLSHYFQKRRALAMTLVAAGSSLGALIHPLMLNNLFQTSLGFHGTTRVSAGVVSFALLIACLLMRPRLAAAPPKAPLLSCIRRFYREWSYIAVSAGTLIFTIGFFFPLFFIQLDAVQHGLSEQFAFNALVIMNGCSLIGRILPGFFANSLGVINMVIASCVGCTVLIFSMIALSNVASVVSIAVLYGLNAGVFVSLQAPMMAALTTDMSELGARMGVAYTFCAFGALIGPPMHGALLTSNFIWWRPALVSGIFALLGCVCFVSIHFFRRREVEPEPTPPTQVSDLDAAGEKRTQVDEPPPEPAPEPETSN